MPAWLPVGLKLSLLMFLSVGVLRTLALFAKNFLTGIINQTFLKIQRSLIFDYTMYNAHLLNSHEVISLFTDNLSRVGGVIIDVTGLLISVVSLTLLFGTGLKLAPMEMVIGFIGLIAVVFPLKYLNSKINTFGKGITDEWSIINKYLLEELKQNYFFRAHGLEEIQIGKAHRAISNYKKHYTFYYFLSSFKNSITNIAGILLICVMSYLGVTKFHTAPTKLLALLYVFVRFSQGAGEILVVLSHLRLNVTSIGEVLSFNEKIQNFKRIHRLENETKSKEKKHLARSIVINSINVENLSFAYNHSHNVLSNINFTLKRGDLFVITGESGAGKSTLLSLLLGVIKPTKGSISFNDFSHIYGIDDIREILAYVGPDPYLFNGTLRENLLFGNKRTDITNEEIVRVLKGCLAYDFVSKKTSQLDFMLTDHSEISTGQRQRLSISRALLRRPQVLILDEATANLDSNTETEVLNFINQNLTEMMVIMVTHKIELKKMATKVLSL